MQEVHIYGYSDDLIEIEGSLEEEIPLTKGELLLAFGDGTVLEVRYSRVWRITQVAAGSAAFHKQEAPANDENNYSDRVSLTGDLRWLAVGNQFYRITD